MKGLDKTYVWLYITVVQCDRLILLLIGGYSPLTHHHTWILLMIRVLSGIQTWHSSIKPENLHKLSS